MDSARYAAERGLSLVEIMVALSVGAMIAAAGMALAQVMASVNREQSQIQVLSDNMRGALIQISTDARLAGAGMPGGDAVNAATASPAQVPAVRVVNSATGPDRIELLTVPGSAMATTFSSMTAASTSLSVDATGGAGFAAGDYFLLTDFTNGVLYQIGSISSATISGISARTLSVSAAPSFPVTLYAPGSLIVRASSLRYSVGLGTAVGLPTISALLVEDGAPLGVAGGTSLAAENVFDMQIALGIDGANGQPQDGQLTEVGLAANDDEWVYNRAGDTLPAAPFLLRAVRVTLIGRTAVESPGTGPGRPGAEDRPAGAPDRFRWRIQREVIMIRNLVLQ